MRGGRGGGGWSILGSPYFGKLPNDMPNSVSHAGFVPWHILRTPGT